MAASRQVADVLEVRVPIGDRVLVVGGLDLGGSVPASSGAAAAVAGAIESWIGGGLLIFVASTREQPGRGPDDPNLVLMAEPALIRAAASFAAEPNRRVLYLVPSGGDAGRGSEAACRSEAASSEASFAPEIAAAAELDFETGAGRRRVRAEPSSALPVERVPARARELVTAGTTGLITAHAGRAALIRLEQGFYCNAGSLASGGERTSGGHGQVAWVELEAGNDLHVRLLHDRRPSRATRWLKRWQAQVSAGPAGDHEPADVESTWHRGASWPPPANMAIRLRRIRRVSASLVAFAAILSMLSAFSEPFRDRLHRLLSVMPLGIPQAANTVVALASLGLLLLARAIRRGQHRAWVICEGLLVTTAVLHVLKGVDVEEALVAGGVAVFLFVNRSAFRAGVDRPSTRRGLQTLFVGAALAVICGTVGVELGTRMSSGRHHQRLPLPSAMVATVERMIGVRTIALPDRLDDFFTPAMAAVAVGVGLAAAWLLLRPVVARHSGAGERDGSPDGLARARTVVRQSGSGTLDYFALRTDKQFFFRRQSMVAYGVYGSVCLVSPDPIGPVSERRETWQAFHHFADDNGWNIGVLGAGEDWLPVYRTSGMHELYVGDEAVVNCRRFTLEGGRNKGLRQAVNRIAKYGYTISFHDPCRVSPSLRESLELVMTKSRRGEVERGFSMTLGRAFDPHDDGLLLAVVHGPKEAGPVAFCQFVPAPGIDGYSLDLMRRDDGDHPNGLMDFAIVETIRWLRSHDCQGLGLNFATMRAVLAGESGDGISQRVQAWLLRRMSDTMQIESLWKFTAKYDPDWQPRYAVYDAPEHVLPAAFAVARAESFWELPVIGRFLVPAATPPAPGTGDADVEDRPGEDDSLQPTGHP